MATMNRTQRGNTLIEMIFAMVILAILMSLAALEVRNIVQERSFVESHLDAEEQARIGMARVSDAVRQTSVDIADFGAHPPPPIIAPAPAATSTAEIVFYQVAGLSPKTLKVSSSGKPEPCYNKVTIAYQTPEPTTPPNPEGTITEEIQPVAIQCDMVYPTTPTVLARNVEDFSVFPPFGKSTGYLINLTIKAQLATDARQVPTEYTLSDTFVPLAQGLTQ
jgi:prepilin-type N-terminal cleavage/methylation domain-containing protein